MPNTSTPPGQEPRPRAKQSVFWEYARSILLGIALALLIRTFVVQAYEIPSGSMEDTLAINDHILVNKFIYGTRIPFTGHRVLAWREPARGDVIVFEYPKDPSKDYIKRVIGLPGDQLRIVDRQVYINGEVYDNPHAVHKNPDIVPNIVSPRDNTDTITVPPDSYFVMGDNRDNSLDSRYWGFVKKDQIKGLAFIKYWAWDSENHSVRWRSIGHLID
jgi:signal peptidase I